MTLKELRKYVAAYPTLFDDFEVKAWLPGSTISLSPMTVGARKNEDLLVFEGNVDPGSALAGD